VFAEKDGAGGWMASQLAMLWFSFMAGREISMSTKADNGRRLDVKVTRRDTIRDALNREMGR
jgi:hypothetical protein